MSNWPDVTIGIITYKRPEEIKATVLALREHLTYSGHLKFLVADDTSGPNYAPGLKRSNAFKGLDVTFISTPENQGWGHNANNMLTEFTTDYLYFTEDDYVLAHPLNLDIGVALMEASPRIGMLRYRGVAGSNLVMHLAEAKAPMLPTYQDGEGALTEGKINHLIIDGGSPELWVYSNGPHLKHRRFHTFYGPYPQGLRLGATEEKMAHQVKDIMNAKPDAAPWIAILPEWVPLRFKHIGISYQFGDEDNA